MGEMRVKQSIGIDIVDIERISSLMGRYGKRFINRILSEKEKAILTEKPNKAGFLAGRFAAKEAAIKALGEYIGNRPAFQRMSVLPDVEGRPRLTFDRDLAAKMNSTTALVSISHERTHAVAVVLITGSI